MCETTQTQAAFTKCESLEKKLTKFIFIIGRGGEGESEIAKVL